MKPTFIGLGGQKCASSWLYEAFREHPEAFVSTPKELDFFSCFYDRGYQWYEAFFAGAGEKAAIGEISPSYLPDRDAPARAYAYNPRFRIILALRDPVERAYSNHLHDIRLGHYGGSDLSFEAGLENNPMYVDQSRYATHLSRWLEYFPLEQILVVFQEDIKLDPRREAQRLYRFLGISTEHAPELLDKRVNESYLPKSQGRERFFRGIGQLIRKMHMNWLDRMLRDIGVVGAIHRNIRLDIRDIVPPMSMKTREKLAEILGPETVQLAAILGREQLPWDTWARAAGRAGSQAAPERP